MESCDAVVALFSATSTTSSEKSNESNTFLQRMIATLLRNVELRIENCHIRYEDPELCQGKISAFGAMLKEFTVKARAEAKLKPVSNQFQTSFKPLWLLLCLLLAESWTFGRSVLVIQCMDSQ